MDVSHDAFGRLRVSNPVTLFDSTNKYFLSNVFFSNLTSGATVVSLPQESSANLITHTQPSRVIRQSKYSFPYQPGKSLLILNTFAFSNTNSIQRVGYFDDGNGIFLEQSDKLYICKRNNNQDIKIPRTSWNADTLLQLDVTKVQILFIDIEWLGVGSVRVGFFIDGVPILAHTFHNANYTDSVYMKTACLPIRFSIENTQNLQSNAHLKSICSTVVSEGGYEPKSIIHITQVGTISTNLIPIGNGVPTPLISIRIANGFENLCVYIKKISVLMSTRNDIGYWYIIINATLSTPSWSKHEYNSGIDVDTTSTTCSGGRIIQAGLFDTYSNTELDILDSIQIGFKDLNVSETVTLAAASLSGTNSKVVAQLGWFDI